MPTYQYTCTDCGHDLEAVQKFTDDALVECPACTGKLRKVFSAVGVVFKGSGFYRTDSRAKSSSSTPPAASSSDGKSDNKTKANSEHSNPVGKDSSSSSSSDKGSSSKKSSESAA